MFKNHRTLSNPCLLHSLMISTETDSFISYLSRLPLSRTTCSSAQPSATQTGKCIFTNLRDSQHTQWQLITNDDSDKDDKDDSDNDEHSNIKDDNNSGNADGSTSDNHVDSESEPVLCTLQVDVTARDI